MAEAKKIDPFDVEALEKSLNDSATRVSTIWVSFLIFSLYLLTATTTVTHRQLFLAEPVKLPVLNIDLSLWGFLWLGRSCRDLSRLCADPTYPTGADGCGL
jgi:hypothetical protein